MADTIDGHDQLELSGSVSPLSGNGNLLLDGVQIIPQSSIVPSVNLDREKDKPLPAPVLDSYDWNAHCF